MVSRRKKGLEHLKALEQAQKNALIPLGEFFQDIVKKDPALGLRSIFQLFSDMVLANVKEIPDPNDDGESINYVNWDTSLLFEDSESPYFASTVFTNKLVKWIRALRKSAQQNVIYCFTGQPGCGKTTMANNILRSMTRYSHTKAGYYPETVWRIDPAVLGSGGICAPAGLIIDKDRQKKRGDDIIEIVCPGHDHPVLMIPRDDNIRREYLSELFGDNKEEFDRIANAKEYEWVFSGHSCTICDSLFRAILKKTDSIEKVMESIFVRPYYFDRHRGYGVTVFNPGDKPQKEFVLRNPKLQERIDAAFGDSEQVLILFSRYARTNNGIYVLMDIKDYNKDRFLELHNIITDSVLKVEHIEERIRSLFMAVMNPGDEEVIEGKTSFKSRIAEINVPYVIEPETEVKTLESVFGKDIRKRFLPRVLLNFARIIVATRLNRELEAVKEWIGSASKYEQFCDDDLLLLRMGIYSNNIPKWLSDEDKRKMTRQVRQAIIAESEKDGQQGFDGRDSLRLFGSLLDRYKKREVIDMKMLLEFFGGHLLSEFADKINDEPQFKEFLTALQRHYDYYAVRDLKESLFNYNDAEIRREINNYLYSLSYDPGVEIVNKFTGDKFTVTEEMWERTELRFYGVELDKDLRDDLQARYLREGGNLEEPEGTELFQEIFSSYRELAKEQVLDPFLKGKSRGGDNYFRQAVQAYDTDQFDKFDGIVKRDIERMIKNLVEKFGYTPKTAKGLALYVIDGQ